MKKEIIQTKRKLARLNNNLPLEGTQVFNIFGLYIWLDENNNERTFTEEDLRDYKIDIKKLIK